MSEEDGDLKSYQLFRHFKMMLHDEVNSLLPLCNFIGVHGPIMCWSRLDLFYSNYGIHNQDKRLQLSISKMLFVSKAVTDTAKRTKIYIEPFL